MQQLADSKKSTLYHMIYPEINQYFCIHNQVLVLIQKIIYALLPRIFVQCDSFMSQHFTETSLVNYI